MYELKRHKKNDKIKWVLTSIAFLLVIVMLTGICLQLFGTGNQKPSEWFTKNNQSELCTVSFNFDSTCTGSNSYSVGFADNDLMKQLDDGKLDFSFVLIIKHSEKLEYQLVDSTHGQYSDKYFSIKEDEKEQNKYIVTFLPDSSGNGGIKFFVGEELMEVYFHIVNENITIVKNGQVL